MVLPPNVNRRLSCFVVWSDVVKDLENYACILLQLLRPCGIGVLWWLTCFCTILAQFHFPYISLHCNRKHHCREETWVDMLPNHLGKDNKISCDMNYSHGKVTTDDHQVFFCHQKSKSTAVFYKDNRSFER